MNDFYNSLPMLFYRSLDQVMPQFRSIFKQFNITEQQWRVLRVLWEEDQQPLLVLAEKTLIPSPSLVGVIDRLEKLGLVNRIRSVDDRRVVHINATKEGKALQHKVTPLVDAAYLEVQARLNKQEWDTLTNTLQKLITNTP